MKPRPPVSKELVTPGPKAIGGTPKHSPLKLIAYENALRVIAEHFSGTDAGEIAYNVLKQHE